MRVECTVDVNPAAAETSFEWVDEGRPALV
jgi:hypothetical protein